LIVCSTRNRVRVAQILGINRECCAQKLTEHAVDPDTIEGQPPAAARPPRKPCMRIAKLRRDTCVSRFVPISSLPSTTAFLTITVGGYLLGLAGGRRGFDTRGDEKAPQSIDLSETDTTFWPTPSRIARVLV
jgi:hypothetical protein